jgi:hypothetical protein
MKIQDSGSEIANWKECEDKTSLPHHPALMKAPTAYVRFSRGDSAG